MSFNFYIPKLKNGGGELTSLALFSALSEQNGKNAVRLVSAYDSNRFAEYDLDLEINFHKKLSLVYLLLKFLWRHRHKPNVHISVLSGLNIIMGINNLFIRTNLFLYEHSDLSKLYFEGDYPKLKIFIRRFLYNISLVGSDALIFVSDTAKRNSTRYFWNINQRKMKVIENPTLDIRDRLKFVDHQTEPTLLIIARNSIEKRLVEGLRYLDRYGSEARIVLVSDSSNGISQENFPNLDIDFYFDLKQVKKLNLASTVLLNFSRVESFSLVIAEWLSVGGRVFSTKEAEINNYWRRYFNFFELDENEPPTAIFETQGLDDKRAAYMGRSIKAVLNDFLALSESLKT